MKQGAPYSKWSSKKVLDSPAKDANASNPTSTKRINK